MKKKTISEEEYQYAFYQLDMIQKEKDKLAYLSETGAYQAHIKLAKTFEELLINLSRANTELDSLIKLATKKIISELNIKEPTHKTLNKELKLFLTKNINFDELSFIVNNNEKILINPEITFDDFIIKSLNNIISLQNQKTANQQLFDYIKSLTEEECKYHKIVAVYKKQNKKRC